MEDLEVTLLKFVPGVEHLAVFTNTNSIAFTDTVKDRSITRFYKGDKIIKTGEILEYSYAKNCLGVLTEDSEFLVVDPRVPDAFVQKSELNKVRGVPSDIANVKNTR